MKAPLLLQLKLPVKPLHIESFEGWLAAERQKMLEGLRALSRSGG